MKKYLIIFTAIIISAVANAQLLIRGSIQQGEKPNSVNIVYMPDYTSTSGEYVNYLSISVAIPAVSAKGLSVSIKGEGVFSQLSFIKAVPFSYTKDGETVYSWICINPVPVTMSWTMGNPFVGATITFNPSKDAADIGKVKLIDFSNSDEKSEGNTFFVISTSRPNDATSYNNLFYSIKTSKGSVLGKYNNSDQFAEVNLQSELKHDEQKIAGKTNDNPQKFSFENVFPNPAKSQINLLINTPVKDNVTLQITDINGRVVKRQIINIESGSNSIPVDVSKLAAGTYIVKLLCKEQNCEIAIVKFNKQ